MTALVWLAAAGFAIAVFPIHVYNYIYINTADKYLSLNAGLYGKINFINVNSVKNNPSKMQVNGKNKSFDAGKIKMSAYKIFNSVCIYKIVQLGDYGLKSDKNAYFALAQNGLTTALYKIIQRSGHYAKLRNYTVFNAEHDHFIYYAKAVTIINLMVISKIIMILLTEKLNEHKN